jgi:hypothetical protein
MDLEAALHDLAAALAAPNMARHRGGRWQEGRRVLVRRCAEAMTIEPMDVASVDAVVKLAAECPVRGARRSCAVLVIHAMAAPGLVPSGLRADVCALAERGLGDVLLRCGYPFGGSVEDKMRMLEQLHASIADLAQPLEPTFPNWQGLYAG